ncbi:hypothetical protein SNOG_00487 [Parastagonospora nodorum SN15]|uniref:Uncharacterized protein n=1 Tax=Phaeosphaeria nodorum (strain SN15 / ATCC MYA-4574 / FGSC 10173) TaxID=321614 RepID=Q0V677_PHANO|nr:hypothetical protein SNOG_00487 [Parastagonospora nodorum SN15]EAT91982.1 hypothetical protein SNOG_00487 [Parastagonospora nodorum SN15]
MWRELVRLARRSFTPNAAATKLGDDPATRLKTDGPAEAFKEPWCAENNKMHLRRPRARSRVACRPPEGNHGVHDGAASICAADAVLFLIPIAAKFIAATISTF